MGRFSEPSVQHGMLPMLLWHTSATGRNSGLGELCAKSCPGSWLGARRAPIWPTPWVVMGYHTSTMLGTREDGVTANTARHGPFSGALRTHVERQCAWNIQAARPVIKYEHGSKRNDACLTRRLTARPPGRCHALVRATTRGPSKVHPGLELTCREGGHIVGAERRNQ